MTSLGQQPPGVARIQDRVLGWYATNQRDLPWRRTRDPYAILVAEVMLQQTQVDRVLPKWRAWLERFPTLADLAEASPADAIRAWQGLGYNLRALRLHAVARQVVADFGGQLPRSVEGLLDLKGVGRYTAGAVACFAYEQPVAMVDTNVRRVLSRVFGVEPKSIESLADTVVPHERAYAWNQALMDLGASLCRAKRPLCLACPLLVECGGPREAGGSIGSTATPASSIGPTAPPAGQFHGSGRFYRGRIVDTLRSLPEQASIPLDELVRCVAPAPQRDRLCVLVRQLASEGLLSLDAEHRVRLPD